MDVLSIQKRKKDEERERQQGNKKITSIKIPLLVD